MARVVFLGTAGNTAVSRRYNRSSGGIIVQVEDLQFHLDPGPGALVKAQEFGINPHHTTAVLVSHNHLNHCNDLNLVIEALTHGGIEHRGILMAAKSVLQEMEQSRPCITKYHQSLIERSIAAEKNHKIALDLVEINALPADHTDATAIGFRLFCPKFTLSYTGDTALTSELLEQTAGSDILILNVPYPGNKAVGKNLDTQAALKMITTIKPKLAIITHFGIDMIKADPMQEAREIQRLSGVQTLAAQDGLSITPDYGQLRANVRGYN